MSRLCHRGCLPVFHRLLTVFCILDFRGKSGCQLGCSTEPRQGWVDLRPLTPCRLHSLRADVETGVTCVSCILYSRLRFAQSFLARRLSVLCISGRRGGFPNALGVSWAASLGMENHLAALDQSCILNGPNRSLAGSAGRTGRHGTCPAQFLDEPRTLSAFFDPWPGPAFRRMGGGCKIPTRIPIAIHQLMPPPFPCPRRALSPPIPSANPKALPPFVATTPGHETGLLLFLYAAF